MELLKLHAKHFYLTRHILFSFQILHHLETSLHASVICFIEIFASSSYYNNCIRGKYMQMWPDS